jgi:methylmalonyl-CoA/ethylmalonyl-CoA epimerase
MFERIDHVAFVVEDLAAGRAEFEDGYGLECVGTNDEAHRQTSGAAAAFYEVGEVTIELLSPLADADTEGWAHEYLAEHGAGFFHVAYAVPDLEAAAASVQEGGIRLAHEEPVQGFSGRLLTCHPADTLVPTQLVEPDDG